MKINGQDVRVETGVGAGLSLRGPSTARCKTTVTVAVMAICLGLGTVARLASATVCFQHDGNTDPLAGDFGNPRRDYLPAA